MNRPNPTTATTTVVVVVAVIIIIILLLLYYIVFIFMVFQNTINQKMFRIYTKMHVRKKKYYHYERGHPEKKANLCCLHV